MIVKKTALMAWDYPGETWTHQEQLGQADINVENIRGIFVIHLHNHKQLITRLPTTPVKRKTNNNFNRIVGSSLTATTITRSTVCPTISSTTVFPLSSPMLTCAWPLASTQPSIAKPKTHLALWALHDVKEICSSFKEAEDAVQEVLDWVQHLTGWRGGPTKDLGSKLKSVKRLCWRCQCWWDWSPHPNHCKQTSSCEILEWMKLTDADLHLQGGWV